MAFKNYTTDDQLPIVNFTFTFMHLADAFIQSNLHCIQAIIFFVCMCVCNFMLCSAVAYIIIENDD